MRTKAGEFRQDDYNKYNDASIKKVCDYLIKKDFTVPHKDEDYDIVYFIKILAKTIRASTILLTLDLLIKSTLKTSLTICFSFSCLVIIIFYLINNNLDMCLNLQSLNLENK